MSHQLPLFEIEKAPNRVVNVASVPHRSPFRYPGGKTWLIPTVRKWLKSTEKAPLLIEPFAGGGIVSLTAAFENLAEKIQMVELDEEVSAVWEAILNGQNQWLAERILSFDLTSENVKTELEKPEKALRDLAFCTILKNRTFHGGILAKGSGMLKMGENGRGIHSRWYPKTLHDRIRAIGLVREKIEFECGDAFSILEKRQADSSAFFFIDPPYLAAGKRLYTHFDIDHERLFSLSARLKGRFLMTYDDAPAIRNLAQKHDLPFRTVPMKTTHHLEKHEILISDSFDWL